MPIDKLIYLGNRIRAARKDCNLTQQELADQCGLAVKTIQDIEKGRKNATYETLASLIERLGIPANTLFQPKTSIEMAVTICLNRKRKGERNEIRRNCRNPYTVT